MRIAGSHLVAPRPEITVDKVFQKLLSTETFLARGMLKPKSEPVTFGPNHLIPAPAPATHRALVCQLAGPISYS